MPDKLQSALSILRAAREKSDRCLVFYSGGKDSLACMEMAHLTFKEVVGVFMYLVPGMRQDEQQLAFARSRWGCRIVTFPHFVAIRALKWGVFCNEEHNYELPELKLRDIYNLVIHDTGIPIIVQGAKLSDSMWRRRNFYLTQHWSDVIRPLKDWQKEDVVAYLRTRSIPIPKQDSNSNSGADLTAKYLLWCHATYPDDFKKICEVFPYAEAVIHREQWYRDQEEG